MEVSGEENSCKIESKGRKGSINIASGHEGKKQFKCDICNVKFGQMSKLKLHVATVHEGKRPFNCNICNANFGQKGNMNSHVATVHDGM